MSDRIPLIYGLSQVYGGTPACDRQKTQHSWARAGEASGCSQPDSNAFTPLSRRIRRVYCAGLKPCGQLDRYAEHNAIRAESGLDTMLSAFKQRSCRARFGDEHWTASPLIRALSPACLF